MVLKQVELSSNPMSALPPIKMLKIPHVRSHLLREMLGPNMKNSDRILIK